MTLSVGDHTKPAPQDLLVSGSSSRLPLRTRDDADVRERAIADLLVGFLGAAQVVVVAAGFHVARAGEHVVQVGRAEAGAVIAAHQQRVERPEFEAEVVGELADVVAGEVIAVVTAGGAELEHLDATGTRNS